MIPESQDAVAALLEKTGAIFVIGARAVRTMLSTIKFNDQLHGRAEEIHDVGTDGLLAAETEALKLAAPKERPQNAFGIRGIRAQVFGEVAFEKAATGGIGFWLWH